MGKPSGGTPPDKSRKRPSLSSEDGPPRKPATAFALFSKSLIHDASSPLRARDSNHAKLAANAWTLLSTDQRQSWMALAAHEQERYEQEKVAYDLLGKRARHGKAEEDLITTINVDGVEIHRPKQPATSFTNFAVHYRRNLADKQKVSAADVGEAWRQLSKEERAPFEHVARDELEKYERELAVWCDQLARLTEQAQDEV